MLAPLPGWRRVAIAHVVLVWVVALILFIAVVSALSSGASFLGAHVLSSGSCPSSTTRAAVIRILVNVVATLILAGTNYAMQLVCAPSREDVDHAHATGNWLEIGVQSTRNWRWISESRRNVWLVLAFCCVPIHVLLNAAVIEVRSSSDFLMVQASESILNLNGSTGNALGPVVAMAPGSGNLMKRAAYDDDIVSTIYFDSGSASDNSTSANGQDDEDDVGSDTQASAMEKARDEANAYLTDDIGGKAAEWDKIGLEECVKRYGEWNGILTEHRHVVMVINNEGDDPVEGWTAVDSRTDLEGEERTSDLNAVWLAARFRRTNQWRYDTSRSKGKRAKALKERGSLNTIMDLNTKTGRLVSPDPDAFDDGLSRMKASYCLSEPYISECRVDLHVLPLLIATLLCIANGVICTAAFLKLRERKLLLTVGDAIESFVTDPDPATAGMCWLSKQHLLDDTEFGKDNKKGQAFAWKNVENRAWRTVPGLMLTGSAALLFALFALAAGFAGWACAEWSPSKGTFGPGATNHVFSDLSSGWTRPVVIALIANLPQLVLSIGYLIQNGLLTRMFSELEWSRYGQDWRTLRVSNGARGQQRSAHTLSIPLVCSVPLLVLAAAAHWLVANSIYMAVFQSFSGLPPNNGKYTSWTGQAPAVDTSKGFVGMSSTALIAAAVVIAVFSALPAILGSLKLRGPMPMAGGCSAVVSAACHVLVPYHVDSEGMGPKAQDPVMLVEDMVAAEVKWGVVVPAQGNLRPGHLSFGTKAQGVANPEEGAGERYCGVENPVG